MRDGRGDQLSLGGATIFRAFCLWVVSLIIAATGGSAELGKFAFVLAVASPIFVFLEFGLRNIAVTLTSRPSLRNLLQMRVGSAALATGLTFVSLRILNEDLAGLALAVGLAKSADSVLDAMFGLLQRDGHLRPVALVTFLNGGLILAGMYAVMSLTGSLNLALYGWAIASSSLVVFTAVIIQRAGSRTRQGSDGTRAGLAELLRAGLPNGGAQALISLLTYLPVIALGYFGDDAAVGVFTAVAYYLTFGNVALAALQQAILPALSLSVRNRSKGWHSARRRYSIVLIAVSVVGGLLTALLGGTVLVFAYGAEFDVSRAVISLIAGGVALLGPVYAAGGRLLVANAYGAQFQIAALSLVVTIVAILALGVGFDLEAAAFAALLGTGVRAAGGTLAAGHFEGRRLGS